MPPIKPVKITDRVLYKSGEMYKMASLKTGKYLGKIKLVPKKDRLYIADMKSNFPENKKLRVGTSLIHFAKQISKQHNFGGKLEVISHNLECGGKQPHKFYRKMGFSTHNKRLDEDIDFCMEYDIDIPYYMQQGTTMFWG